MKKKKIVCICVAFVLIAALSAGVTLAAFSASKDTLNIVTFGNVHIELIDLYTKPVKGVVPGQTVDKIVTAKNTGTSDAYVRLKLTKSWWDSEKRRDDLDPSYIELGFQNPDKWVQGSDGYYYYQFPLKPGETAENLINSFSLPQKWDMDGYTALDGHIDASAQAVQYENFTPQINSQGEITGWNNIKVEDAVDRVPQLPAVEGDTDTGVIYQHDAQRFVTLPGDDLFAGFKGVMPGDVKTQKINIKNENNETTFIYLYALQAEEDKFDSPQQKAISDELMKLLQINITKTVSGQADSVIYTGKLYGEDESFSMYGEPKAVSLGGYKTGERAQLKVELKVPQELNNRYADAIAKIKWIFTSVQQPDPVRPPQPPDIIETGDALKDILPALASAAAILLLTAAAMLFIKKRNRAD